VSVAAAEGLTLAPSYRPGCGFTAMPGNELVFPVANKTRLQPVGCLLLPDLSERESLPDLS
jgi:hypothetical protein